MEAKENIMSSKSSFSIDKVRDTKNDTNKQLEDFKGKATDYESSLKELYALDAEISGSDIDESAKDQVFELIGEKKEEVEGKAQENANEMDGIFRDLDSARTDVNIALDSGKEQIATMKSKQAILEKIGMGNALDGAINTIDSSNQELQTLMNELIELENEAKGAHDRLAHLDIKNN